MRAVAVIAALLAAFATAGKINHIVVLMEENRSFDHMLGLFNGTTRGTRGKNFTNVISYNSSDGKPLKKTVTWQGGAPYVNMCDPDHNLPPTTYKLFGTYDPAPDANATMSGFAQFEYEHQKDNFTVEECNVMMGFESERVPVMTALAENFVLMDNFFCSVPGPTWPNRMFFMKASSDGLTETGPWYRDDPGRLFPGKTIFDQVKEAGGSWALYYDDAVWELFLETLAHQPEHLKGMDQFFHDAAHGTLPHFSFINPRAGVNLTLNVGSNDMHPDHDVALGEALYRDVYQALRRSPKWEETLFVLTFDEHGGFFDHVPPPRNVPNPENFDWTFPDKFAFDRGGVRIPTILISPWLPKGMTLSDPPRAQMPADNSAYELTSIMATTRKLLDFMNTTGPLTKRDAWAATFEHLFDLLPAPRKDCPMDLPAPPPPAGRAQLVQEAAMPVNPLQTRIMEVHANLAGVPYPAHITQQGDVEPWVRHHFGVHVEHTMRWKGSKAASQSASVTKRERGAPATSKLAPLASREHLPGQNFSLMVALQPLQLDCLGNNWLERVDMTTRRATFSINITDPKSRKTAEYCLDHGDAKESAFVGLSLCYPSSDPTMNRDPAQQWLHTNDVSIRPFGNTSLCVDNTINGPEGGMELFLARCSNAPTQAYSWQGASAVQPGSGPGNIFYGDAVYEIDVVHRKSE